MVNNPTGNQIKRERKNLIKKKMGENTHRIKRVKMTRKKIIFFYCKKKKEMKQLLISPKQDKKKVSLLSDNREN